jgi:UDP-N-acetylenolpyruvoylglucosamine reductase
MGEALDAGGEIRRINGRDMDFGYRRSRLQDEDLIALSVELELVPGDGRPFRRGWMSWPNGGGKHSP